MLRHRYSKTPVVDGSQPAEFTIFDSICLHEVARPGFYEDFQFMLRLTSFCKSQRRTLLKLIEAEGRELPRKRYGTRQTQEMNAVLIFGSRYALRDEHVEDAAEAGD